MNRQLMIYISMGVGVVLLLLLYILFAYFPLAKKMNEKKQVLKLEKQFLIEEQALLARTDEFSERTSKSRIDKEKLDEQFPVSERMPELIKAVSRAATECRLGQLKFIPMSIIEKEGYLELPIELAVSCRYHSLGEFIEKVSSLPRLMTVRVIEIKGSDSTGQSDTIKASLMLVTYVKKK